jgi:ABC-type glutathione transport system ATPase component
MVPICVATGLGVSYSTRSGTVTALAGVDLALHSSTVYGVVGASGAGKSTLGLALSGLLPAGSHRTGELAFGDRRVEREADWDSIRGRGVTYVPQEPALALSPVLRAVTQVRDAAMCAFGMSRRDATNAARDALGKAGLERNSLQNAYPHEMSGGERQRVLLARAFLLKSQLIVADEPTSALDAVTQLGILRLFEQLRTGGSAVLFITHTPHILRGLASEALLIAGGRLRVRGSLEDVMKAERASMGDAA